MSGEGIGRRTFFRIMAAILLAWRWIAGVAEAAPGRSRVVTVHAPGASPGAGVDNADLDAAVVRRMVERGVIACTGASDLKGAWRRVIPDSSKRVAIKVNCQIRGIYSKAKVVQPIIDGLVLSGVAPDNIIVYDMTDTAFDLAGFRRNTGSGVKVGRVQDFGGYSRFFRHRLANLLTGGHGYSGLNLLAQALNGKGGPWDCDYLINVPVLKALDGYCGVTLAMKNHYGSIANPGEHHKDIMEHIPLVNSLPEIRNKTRLVVLDAIFGEYRWVNGRDQRYVTRVNRLLFSTDPVAIDATGWRMIDSLRKEHGMGPVSPAPLYIARAEALGLGVADPARIELQQVVLK